jgi:Zn-dependent M16 (insulinase) family peptidase
MPQRATYGYVLLRNYLSIWLNEFQRYIRGSGLAYGAYIANDTEAGLLTFSLYRVRLLQ